MKCHMSCLRVSPLFFPCMTSGFLYGRADSFEIRSNPISPAYAVHNLRLNPPFFSYRKSLITCMLLSSAQTWMAPKTSFSFSGRSSYHTGHLLVAPQAHWYSQVVITVYGVSIHHPSPIHLKFCSETHKTIFQ